MTRKLNGKKERKKTMQVSSKRGPRKKLVGLEVCSQAGTAIVRCSSNFPAME